MLETQSYACPKQLITYLWDAVCCIAFIVAQNSIMYFDPYEHMFKKYFHNASILLF